MPTQMILAHVAFGCGCHCFPTAVSCLQELMQMPVLEGELQKTETVLLQTQKHLDEKASALTVTRKNLRSVKDKNSVGCTM